MKPKSRWITAGVLAALAAATVVVASTSGGGTRAAASAAQAPISVLASGSAAPMATATLDPGLLAGARRRAAAAMPANQAVIDIDTARQALAITGGTQVIAGSGSGGEVCAMLATTVNAGGPNAAPADAPTCVPADEFKARGVSATFGSGSDVWVFGLVPDGVDSVTLTFADDSTTAMKVANNAFALHATKATKALSFTGPAGPVTVDSRSLDG
jgi:hypothetical protein